MLDLGPFRSEDGMGPYLVRHPWRLFWIALGATALLALGVGFGVGDLRGWTRPPPRLSTVPAEAVARAGITLAAPNQPPYCDTATTLAGPGWVAGSVGGCPISEHAASAAAAAQPDGHGTIGEAVLAQVTATEGGAIGQNRLAWVVVVHSRHPTLPTTRCAPPRPNGPACAARGLGRVSTESVVVVDGSSGQVLATFPVAADLG
jgi:hypothetical protein